MIGLAIGLVDVLLHHSLGGDRFNGSHENISDDRDTKEEEAQEKEIRETKERRWHKGGTWDEDH